MVQHVLIPLQQLVRRIIFTLHKIQRLSYLSLLRYACQEPIKQQEASKNTVTMGACALAVTL